VKTLPTALKRVIAVAALGAIFPAAAWSCQAGYYKAGFVCLPNSGTVTKVATTPLQVLPDVLNVGGAVVHGDLKGLYEAVGKILIATECQACDELTKDLISKNDKAIIEEMVGEGWLLYVSGGDPILIVADLADTSVTEYVLKPPSAGTPPPALPAARGHKHFVFSNAVCILKSATGVITAEWSASPTTVDPADHKPYIWPSVDVLPDDTITVQAKTCSSDAVQDVQQVSLTQATFTFAWSNEVPGVGQNRIHIALEGNIVP